ncbi:MAG: DUF3048 domain-containing protein [Clostridia bacterium]|nr:DUF3048 domain-containing protein [Clostridia bacterium]
MYKKVLTLVLAVSVMLTFAGCGKGKDTSNELDETLPKEEVVTDPISVEIKTYLDNFVNSDKRPIAVMIDNDNKDARPQAGMDEAYLVYEMPVEAGATRFMALFRSTNTEKIGPVRSSRHYFLDFVKENNAIYTHFGWSPKAANDITSLKVNNINGVLGSDEGVFWRERKYKGDWHSAYTSIKNIEELAAQKGYERDTNNQNGIKYSTEYINLSSENKALDVTLPYSNMYKTSYKYNEETGLYEKYIGSAAHEMQSGNVLAFKNVIIEFIVDKALGDGSARREIITTGSGKGYYFTNGAYEEITWSKDSRTAPTIYKKADGTELQINPGNTIINVINPNNGVTIK